MKNAIQSKKNLGKHLHEYMMYIALVIIMVFFNANTKGGFLQARNISNLINQAGYVAILGIGMTIILIICHIDLSVGYVAGFCGAVAAILLEKYKLGFIPTILLVLILGIAIGFYQGFLVTRLGVPAFVTTLAGMFMFRGLLALSLQKTGTIIISNETFNKLSNGFIPDFAHSKLHMTTCVVGAILIILFVILEIKARQNKQKYNFATTNSLGFLFKLILGSVIITSITLLLASDNGIPWTAIIVGIVLCVYHYILTKTRLGRHIYGIGGNAQAAELSGVNVKNTTLFAFVSMGFLAALAGILFTSRLQSATPQAGMAFELDAIASAYIGGVAVSGGIGKVTNTIIGTLVITSLTNGMNLMQVDVSYQYIVKGIIFIIAVAVDVRTRAKGN